MEAFRKVVEGDDEATSSSDDAVAEIRKLKIEVYQSENGIENENELSE